MTSAKNQFDTPAYRRSRAFEYFVSLLVADAFLATLLKQIGLSDVLIGIISSFIMLAFPYKRALALISLVITILAILFIRLVISKQKVMVQ